MPRDLSGNWVFYAGNPVTTGTTIASSWWNGTYGDLGSSIGASLDRTGATGGMTGQFKAADGTVGAPGISFGSDPTTGFYYPAPGDFRLSLLGADLVKWANATAAMTVIATASTDGIVVTAGAGNQNGVKSTATGSGKGVWGVGVSGGIGVYATSSSTAVDVVKADGYLDMSSATNPASTTGFTSRLTPKNIVKVHCSCYINGGAVTVRDGFNIQAGGSWTLSFLGNITAPFTTALADTNYTWIARADLGQTLLVHLVTKNTTSVVFNIMLVSSPGSPINPTTVSGAVVDFVIYGAQ